MDNSGKGGGSSDRMSLVISLFALVASGATLYYQFWRGPVVRAYPSHKVYLSKSRQIGVPVAFTNAGTAADVVTEGSLDLTRDAQGPSWAFDLRWVSPFEQRFSFENGKWTEAEQVYSPFTSLSLKAGDTDAEVFWFEPQSGNFSFQPGRYTACTHFVSAEKKTIPSGEKIGKSGPQQDCSSFITFELDSGMLGILNGGSQDNVALDVKE
jgi:hypothetical protein